MTESILNAMYEADIQHEAQRPGPFLSGRDRGGSFAVGRTDVFCAALHSGDPDGVHCDAGDFMLFYRNRPVLYDLGSGYAQTFHHNLPMIGEQGQRRGGYACDLDYELRRDTCYLSADLTKAYPDHLALESWQRTVMLSRDAREARLVEVFNFVRERQEVVFHFITPEKPVMQPRIAILGGVAMEWERDFTAAAQQLENGAWRICIALPKPVRSGNATFIFRPVGN